MFDIRLFELIKEMRETQQQIEGKLISMAQENFVDKGKVGKTIKLIDYQVVIILELMKYGIADNSHYETILQNLYGMRTILESV